MSIELSNLPFKEFLLSLNPEEKWVLSLLLLVATALGFVLGRRGASGGHEGRTFGGWRFPAFQNAGESLVSRVLLNHFRAPDYHLMNHVTLRMADGTTQVDHILVSRFGVFVIETKDYSGWIFGSESDAKWTSVRHRLKFSFQNPIRQNYRHVVAVQDLLDFVPRDAITSVVVFCGSGQFKTPIPDGVVLIDGLVDYLQRQTAERIALNRVQYAVGRLETARLAISRQTDVDHAEGLRRRLGRRAVGD